MTDNEHSDATGGRRAPFTQPPNAVVDLLHDRPAALALYVVLLRYLRPGKNRCWPSQKTLADECGCKVRMVRYRLDVLIERGLVIVHPRNHVDGRWVDDPTTNVYEVITDPLQISRGQPQGQTQQPQVGGQRQQREGVNGRVRGNNLRLEGRGKKLPQPPAYTSCSEVDELPPLPPIGGEAGRGEVLTLPSEQDLADAFELVDGEDYAGEDGGAVGQGNPPLTVSGNVTVDRVLAAYREGSGIPVPEAGHPDRKHWDNGAKALVKAGYALDDITVRAGVQAKAAKAKGWTPSPWLLSKHWDTNKPKKPKKAKWRGDPFAVDMTGPCPEFPHKRGWVLLLHERGRSLDDIAAEIDHHEAQAAVRGLAGSIERHCYGGTFHVADYFAKHRADLDALRAAVEAGTITRIPRATPPQSTHAVPLTDAERAELHRLPEVEREARLRQHRGAVRRLGLGPDLDRFTYLDALRAEFSVHRVVNA